MYPGYKGNQAYNVMRFKGLWVEAFSQYEHPLPHTTTHLLHEVLDVIKVRVQVTGTGSP